MRRSIETLSSNQGLPESESKVAASLKSKAPSTDLTSRVATVQVVLPAMLS
ncbi:MAG: hypothetical protein JXA42_23280 [Anaerolineales bacterium]|nr:hypothetical protein [Anaerolineales bacterium]